jgi:uncharacterized tellurite resistance protein B-like protein
MGRKITMGWFNREEKKEVLSKIPSEMSPIESVTYLCTAVQISDGQVDMEERNVWIELVSELFPEFSEKRANNFFSEAQLALHSKSKNERKLFTVEVINRIKNLLDTEQVNILGRKIADLVEADGMVMSGEIEIIELIQKHLKIKINFDSEL